METFPRYWPFCVGNPLKRPVTQSFDVFDLLSNKDWVNNHDAGDLRHYRAHYDVTVMRLACKFVTKDWL